MAGNALAECMRAIVVAVGEQAQVPVQDAKLLRLHSNALFALPTAGLVIRIAINREALARIKASLAVTRWLAARGFPCVVPADIVDQPLVVHGYGVSIWRYLPTLATPPATGTDLGRLLRSLHAQPLPPFPLDRLGDLFASVTLAVEQTPGALSDADRSWLSERITELREQWRTMEFPHPPVLIHGDPHPNNLMRTTSNEIVLGDWDGVAIGQLEWDLAQIHYTRRRFGRPTPDELDAFAAAYGWDVREWQGLDALIEIREVTGLGPYIRTAPNRAFSRNEVIRRINTLRRNDTKARWLTPPLPRS